MSTRRTYVDVAAALKSVRDSYAPHWNPNLFRACNDHAHALARMFKSQNRAFDEARFLKDAGVPDPGSIAEVNAAQQRLDARGAKDQS